MIEDNKYYNIKEIASFLNVGTAAVGKYLREGKLHGIKVGPKKSWQAKGGEIKKLMREWNMPV